MKRGISTLMFCLATASVHAADPALYRYDWNGVRNKEQSPVLERAINEQCKPDRLEDITGYVSQQDVAGPYNVFIFCRPGSGQQSVGIGWFLRSKDHDFINQVFSGRRTAIIGYHNGSKEDHA
ncbi:MAG: hypothetical protein RIC89_02685, partial [Pseudomonadales bacterium]